MDLNWADLVIIAIVLVSTLISLIRGFIREAVSLATWICAAWVSFKYSLFVAGFLGSAIEAESIRVGVAGLTLFFCVLIVGALVGAIVGKFVEKTGFSGTDRALGVVFGALRGVLIVGLMVLSAGLTRFPQEPWWLQSSLLPVLQEHVIAYKVYLPEQIAENFDFTRARPPGAYTAPPRSAATA